jgi:hypothetical protein
MAVHRPDKVWPGHNILSTTLLQFPLPSIYTFWIQGTVDTEKSIASNQKPFLPKMGLKKALSVSINHTYFELFLYKSSDELIVLGLIFWLAILPSADTETQSISNKSAWMNIETFFPENLE